MNKKAAVLVLLASFFGTIIFWLFFISMTFRGYLAHFLFPNKYVISSSEVIKDNPKCYEDVGRLVSKGIIVDVKEIWALQGDYYGALISVLIAAIGILGAIAFFYIKSISVDQIRESAESSAVEATSKITGSFDFMSNLHSKIDDKIAAAVEDLDKLDRTTAELKEKLAVIEARISTTDNSEDDGAGLDLK